MTESLLDRMLTAFNTNEIANSFLSEDGDGGFSGAVVRMAAEIARCHARLEIDHVFVMGPGDMDGPATRKEVPMVKRADMFDAVDSRDADIEMTEAMLSCVQSSRDDLLALMRLAHAVMIETGWRNAILVKDGSDGVLAAAATEIEGRFREVLRDE